MGWWNAFLDLFTKSDASSTSYAPLFSVDSTEPLLVTVDVLPELTVRDLNKATKSFSAARLLSQDQRRWRRNVTVYKAVLPSGTPAVAKRLVRSTWTASDDAFLRRQVSVLSMLRHDNLVRLLGYTIAADHRVLLFEFATVGTLRDALHGPTTEEQPRPELTLSWAQRTRIALDAARGLQHLHEAAGVSHTSHWGVSSSKILLFQGLRVKIADYDVFQQQLPDQEPTDVARVTPLNPYHPQEYTMTGRRVRYKLDVYSFGVVLLELLTGRRPMDIILEDHSYHNMLDWATAMLSEGRVKQSIDPKLGTQYPTRQALWLGKIALFCLDDNPASRPSMGTVAKAISVVIRN